MVFKYFEWPELGIEWFTDLSPEVMTEYSFDFLLTVDHKFSPAYYWS